MPVTHRSRSVAAFALVGIDSGVQTGCALFEMNALSIRLENRGGKEAETASGVPLREGESQPCTTLKAWSQRPICEPTRTQSGTVASSQRAPSIPPMSIVPGHPNSFRMPATVFLAAASSPQIIISGLPPANFGSTICVFETVLKHFASASLFGVREAIFTS